MQERTFLKKEQYKSDYSNMLKWLSGRDVPTNIDRSCLASDISFFDIHGILSVTTAESAEQFMSALYSLRIGLVFVYEIANGRIRISMGCESDKIGIVKGLAQKVLGCDCENTILIEGSCFKDNKYCYETVLVGDAQTEEKSENSVIDILMSCGVADNCAAVVTAIPLGNSISDNICNFWGQVQDDVDSLVSRQITSRDDKDSITYTEENSYLKRMQSLIALFQQKFDYSSKKGLFITTVKLFSNSKEVNKLMAGLYISQAKCDELPEQLKGIEIQTGCGDDCIYTNMSELSVKGESIKLPTLGNYHTTKELSFFIELPKHDLLGFYNKPIPRFDVDRNVEEGILLGDILSGKTSVSKYFVPLSDVNRNALVCGLVGSGKTNTVMNLILELERKHIPCLIIEPVKSEYFVLKKYVKDLKVVSIGDAVDSLMINPFQPAKADYPIRQHIENLISTIMAAFEWVEPMPHLVEKIIYRVYADNNIDLDNQEDPVVEKWPTLEQAYWTINKVVEEEGFDSRMESDLKGCISARFNSLRIGSKGDALNVKKSMSMETLFEKNTVIELDNIQDEEAKAFIMGIILTNLKEYCMLRETTHLATQHCTIIEEAHALLRKVDSSSSNSQARGVRAFAGMMKTLRAKGEGFIIVDQVPTELDENVIKNSNLKIIHRMVAADDRSVLGQSCNCNEEQEKYISILTRGEAIVHSEPDFQPKLVKFPYVEVDSFCPEKGQNSKTQKAINYSLYNRNPACLDCLKDDECCMETLKGLIDADAYQEWKESLVKSSSNSEYEDLFMDIMLHLKRHNLFEKTKCILAVLLNDAIESNEQRHTLYFAFKQYIKMIDAGAF